MDNFISWGTFGTFTGAVAGTAALTQLFKRFVGIDPKWIALAVSVVIMVCAQSFAGGLENVRSVVMALFNALIVAGASVGTYETVKSAGNFIKEK